MNSSATRTFVAIVIATAILLAVALAFVSLGFNSDTMSSVAFFALLAFAAHLLAYQLPNGSFGNISFIPYMAAVAVAPTFATALGTALSVLAGEVFQRRLPIKALFNVAQYTGSVTIASLVYIGAGGLPLSDGLSHSLIPFAAAFFSYVVTNTLLVSGVIAVSEGRQVRDVWRRLVGGSVLFDLFALPVVLGFGYVFVRYGPTWTLALSLPLFGIRQLYKTNYQLERVNEELLNLMVAAIEARDPYTSGHSQRVAAYSRIVAQAAHVTGRAAERVFRAALLHDVGKIHEEFAPILRKPGKLTDEEFAVMRSHSAKGAALVARVSQFADLVPAIRGHHEAWNGTGYPDGLNGPNIPVWARIIAVADTVDAMTTDRPYREALQPASVRAELVQQAGRQFDPVIISRLVEPILWKRMEDAIRAMRSTRHHVLTSESAVHAAQPPQKGTGSRKTRLTTTRA